MLGMCLCGDMNTSVGSLICIKGVSKVEESIFDVYLAPCRNLIDWPAMCFHGGHINKTNHREAVLVQKNKYQAGGKFCPRFSEKNRIFLIILDQIIRIYEQS
jgi:hypothetical protein